ncbi:YbjC family protein [Citrobacter europaeus]|uniref:YbjC family protein n=1 Tax=Citrobacter europaeus TaxID=1914243 RepID=UPI0039C39D10
MRTIGTLPKSVLMLEIIGMVLLSLALLSLNDYLSLPAPLSSPLACVVMVFLGVLLMLPAAVVLTWRIAQRLAPQLMSRATGDSSRSDREKRDDANH